PPLEALAAAVGDEIAEGVGDGGFGDVGGVEDEVDDAVVGHALVHERRADGRGREDHQVLGLEAELQDVDAGAFIAHGEVRVSSAEREAGAAELARAAALLGAEAETLAPLEELQP